MEQLTMRVEIADEIRADPELLRDVQAATDYLDTMHERIEPPMLVRWELARDQPDRPEHRPAVVVTLSDWPEYGSVTASSDPLSRTRTQNPEGREWSVSRLWTKLMQNRSRVILDRIAGRFREGLEDSDGE